MNFLGKVTDYETMSRVTYNQKNFNLNRMNRLLSSLGNPHKKLRTVHIAGTKGKGSTASMLSNMLLGCGYKVGMYTSPHVLDLRERITVDDSWISEQDFVRGVNLIAPFVRSCKGTPPTFFELLTAIALEHFATNEVDVAVVEAGLGGRLDSTNVLRPEVCAITSISYDHTAQLGPTLDKIAAEKGGILKSGIPAISAPQHPEVEKILREAAATEGTELQFTGQEIEFSYRFESSRVVGPHSRVCLTTPTSHFEHLHVPLPGEHQAVNCGVALSLLDVLKGRGFEIDEQRAIQGLSKASLPGRMEIISEEPQVLVDGAHNAASIEALMRTIGQSVSYDSMIVIFGCQTGKDLEGMIRHVQLGADKIIFTKSMTPNAVEPEVLTAAFAEQSGNIAQSAPSLEHALRIAGGAVSSEDLICITGSFYLVGEAKRHFAQTST
jgi:dihydrofolate synthase/folylpolyglutamate synthase